MMAPTRKKSAESARCRLKLKSASCESREKSISVFEAELHHKIDVVSFAKETFSDDAKYFAAGTRVLCQHTDSFYYDAKILRVAKTSQGIQYTIHYNGWNQRYDEELTHEEALTKFLPYTEKNVQLAKHEISEARKCRKVRSSGKKEEKKGKSDHNTGDKKQSKKREKSKKRHEKRIPLSRRVRIVAESEPEEESEDEAASGLYLSQMPKNKILSQMIFPEVLDKVMIDDCDLVTRQYKLPKIPARISIDQIVDEYITASRDPTTDVIPRSETDYEALRIIIDFFNKCINVHILYKFEFVQHLNLLNEKRRAIGLPDVPLTEVNIPPESADRDSPAEEDVKDDHDLAFVPSKSSNREADADVDRRSLRETRAKNDLNRSILKPKDIKKKQEKFKFELRKEEDNKPMFKFSDSYGFLHLLRFLYYYSSLAKNKTIGTAIFTKYAEVINEFIEFLSVRVDRWFNVDDDYEIATPAYQRQAFGF